MYDVWQQKSMYQTKNEYTVSHIVIHRFMEIQVDMDGQVIIAGVMYATVNMIYNYCYVDDASNRILCR